jgi:VWFA-related protein
MARTTQLQLIILAAAQVAAALALSARQQPTDTPRSAARFRGGVEMVSIAATVSDENGRFVPGLQRDDFAVYEDDQPQAISYFNTDRLPVSLGIVLDTSGSMAGERIADARAALDRFAFDLLDSRDEVFLSRFSDHPVLVHDWTTDRESLSRAMARITPDGGTAMYDAVLDALPLAARGHNNKKALVIISDGNDTISRASLQDARSAIRNSEVLVYAVGIDADQPSEGAQPAPTRPRPAFPPQAPPTLTPPGLGRRPGGRFPVLPQVTSQGTGGGRPRSYVDDHVNSAALHDLTDDSGGRTEIVREARDLNPATASIADELSRQYSLAYASSLKKDGRWHALRLEVRNHANHVRARRGFVAS